MSTGRTTGSRHRQLQLSLSPTLSRAVLEEAGRRGLTIDASASDVDVRLVGEIGALTAALNAALERAAAAGIDVSVVAHYQDQAPPARKRCVVRTAMRRLALDVML